MQTRVCSEEGEISDSSESRAIDPCIPISLTRRVSPPRSRSGIACTSRADQPTICGRREEGGTGRRGGRAHTLRASPLPVYVRALHPATLRPPARPRDRPRYGIDRYRHPRTRSYGINGKMSGDALTPPRLASPHLAPRRVVASRPRGTAAAAAAAVTYVSAGI